MTFETEGRDRRDSRIPELAMSKHEQRAPRPSQLKLTVKRKRLSFPNGANRRASCAKTATTTANGANRRASAVAPPTACVTSAEMALGLRQTSHSSGAALPPPFPFLWLLVQFFQRPLIQQTCLIEDFVWKKRHLGLPLYIDRFSD